MQSAVIIAAIALAVFLGYKTKINTGFFCIVFAYFIGCFWLDLKPKALIAFWPDEHDVRHHLRFVVL